MTATGLLSSAADIGDSDCILSWLTLVFMLLIRLHQQIMDIGGNKLKAVQSRLDMISGQIDQTTGLKNKANVAVKSAKRYNYVIFICIVSQTRKPS